MIESNMRASSEEHTIIGHEQIIDFFNAIKKHGNVHHAYCFVGPDHVGKKTLVNFLASGFLGCAPDRLGQSPDFFAVGRGIDEKTGKTKKDIHIDQIRELISYLSRSAFVKNGYKVSAIYNAELLNNHSANALLKTLEQPGSRTILFLTVADEDALPKTVLSRCETIYCTPVSTEKLVSGLTRLGASADLAVEIAEEARGLVGQAYTWMSNPETFIEHKAEVSRFKNFIGKSFSDKLHMVEDLFGDKTDHIQTRIHITNVLQIWRTTLRDMWFNGDALSGGWTKAAILRVEEEILSARERIEQNVHPRLLLETILLHIP